MGRDNVGGGGGAGAVVAVGAEFKGAGGDEDVATLAAFGGANFFTSPIAHQ